MDKLLTKKDLAARWQVSERTIDEYRLNGIIKAVKNLPCIRYNLQYIQEIEETKIDKFSPVERRRLEKELEEWKERALKAEEALVRANNILSEALYLRSSLENK